MVIRALRVDPILRRRKKPLMRLVNVFLLLVFGALTAYLIRGRFHVLSNYTSELVGVSAGCVLVSHS